MIQNPPPLRIENVELFQFALRTRLPFRYGIAEMRALPHCFLRAAVRIGGQIHTGLAADHLPPHWFTKQRHQSETAEREQLWTVIRRAAVEAIGSEAPSAFAWWRDAYARQVAWGQREGHPALLAHFGVTLVERAVIGAVCRAVGRPFHQALLGGALGFEPAAVHPELAGREWREAIPETPPARVYVRHTVGLGDPVFAADVPAGARLEDGLPETLAEAVARYGISHFKVKLSGQEERDREQLDRISRCLEGMGSKPYLLTLDGNEQYESGETFAKAWRRLSASRLLRSPRARLWCIEQPVHREAPSDFTPALVRELEGRPRLIIDEGDGAIESLPEALERGYSGTSHKNCKGIFKGLSHRCLLHARDVRRGRGREAESLMTGEDLSNIGPVALPQDLVVQATLGITSVERNGHHYFRGLNAFPRAINDLAVEATPRLYLRHPAGFASLRIKDGALDLGDLQKEGLGEPPGLDPAAWASPVEL